MSATDELDGVDDDAVAGVADQLSESSVDVETAVPAAVVDVDARCVLVVPAFVALAFVAVAVAVAVPVVIELAAM